MQVNFAPPGAQMASASAGASSNLQSSLSTPNGQSLSLSNRAAGFSSGAQKFGMEPVSGVCCCCCAAPFMAIAGVFTAVVAAIGGALG